MSETPEVTALREALAFYADPKTWKHQRPSTSGGTLSDQTWRCDEKRSHGTCNSFNDIEDETCGACGADRPVAPPSRDAAPTPEPNTLHNAGFRWLPEYQTRVTISDEDKHALAVGRSLLAALETVRHGTLKIDDWFGRFEIELRDVDDERIEEPDATRALAAELSAARANA